MKRVAKIMLGFKKTEYWGKEILASSEIGAAAAATRRKDYEKAYNLYRTIIDRGGETTGEIIACKRIAWFYANGIGVEKNPTFAKQIKQRGKTIEFERTRKNSE